MAKNKITIDVMVNGKMEKATVSAKKLRKELANADKAQQGLNTSTRKGYRAAQGSAQNTANSTKAFSKQAGVVGGLVPIYATFAANVFAVSAAFGVLSRNAAVQQLETSLNNIGIAAGRNLPQVASNLKDITGGAISTEAALRATAIATTSGFSTKQLQDLTKVATGASIALGRNLPDALDRLVRGTAKLEPEILDELGIIVRLDQATREYAASVGKTASELTQFERQQAFLNATITQGLNKYQKIAQTVDPNPYDRLSAAFTDLTKSTVELANKGLVPIIEFLSESPTALFAALGLFSTTIVSQIIPAISDMAAASADRFAATAKDAKEAAKKITNEYAEAAKGIQTYDFMPKGFRELAPTLRAGTKDLKVYDKSIKSLTISSTRRRQEINKVKAATAELSGFQKQASLEYLKMKEAELAAIDAEITRIERLRSIQQSGFVGPVVVGGGNVQKAQKAARVSGARARSQDIEKKALDKIGAAGALGALGIFASTLPQFTKNLGELEGATEKTKQGFRSLGSAGKLLGAVFTRLLGPLSLLFLGYSILAPVVENLFFKESKLDKATKEVSKSFTNITKIVVAFKKELITLDSDFVKATRRMEITAGIIDQTSGALATLQDRANKITLDALNAEIDKLISLEDPKMTFERFFSSAAAGFDSSQTTAANIKTVNEEIDRLIDNVDKVPALNALVVLKTKFKELEKSGAFTLFPKLRSIYNELIADLENKDTGELVSLDTLIDDLDSASENQKKFESATKASTQALQQFDAERAKLANKDRTEFSAAIRTQTTYLNELKQAREAFIAENSDAGGYNIAAQERKDFSQADETQAAFLEKKLEDIVIGRSKTPGIEIKNQQGLIIAQEKYNELLTEAEDKLVKAKGLLDQQQAILKRINSVAAVGAGFVESQIKQEDKVREAKINNLQNQIDTNALLLTEEQALDRNAGLQEQINALQNEGNNSLQDTYRIRQDNIAAAKESLEVAQKDVANLKTANDILQKRADLQRRQAAETRSRDRFSFLNEDENALKDEIKAVEDELKRKTAFADAEFKVKQQAILLEYMLLDAKYEYLAAEAKALKDKAIEADPDADVSGFEKTLRRVANIREGLGAEKLVFGKDGIEGFKNAGGALGQALQNLADQGALDIDLLKQKLKELKNDLEDMDTVERALDAAAKAMHSSFSTFFTDVINGTKSVKDAFKDMANSILQSIQKVFADKVAEGFIGFLGDKLGGEDGLFNGFFSKLFKKPGAEQTAPKDPLATGGYSSESIDDQINSLTTPAPVTAMEGMGGVGFGGGGLDGSGLGASASMPVYVTMVSDPMAGMGAGVGGVAASAEGGPAALPSAESTGESEAAKATKENTEATNKLNLNTASMVTGTLATVAALTGNEKVAKKLAMVTAALQSIQALKFLYDKFFAPKKITSEALNTLALKANTAALYMNAASPLRTGGIISNGQMVKGYSAGGVAKGSQGGYPAILHGTEAVVPLPNGKSIPVEMSGAGGMQQNNVSVNVVMNSDGTSSQSQQQDGKEAAQLGKNISIAVQEEIRKQKRNGGMLSPYGSA